MSRIGKKPITIPSGVTVSIGEGNNVTVKGPKGTLEKTFHKSMKIIKEDNVLRVERPSEDKFYKSLHGLTRSLLFNMIEGVTNGYKKTLEVSGVGFRVAKQGKQLVMNLGFSHQVFMDEAPGITVEVPAPNQIVISGTDKQAVGQFAAEVRRKRPPEPYKGKGIKYVGERVVRKEGKAGKK